MKANVPEKIYLFENPISSTPDDRWLSKRSGDTDVEYTRTDYFIEKAENYLRNKCHRFILTEKDIEDFVNYMKEEKI